ncbi:MAG: phosphoglucomutase/phosphomannomutase family protein [Acidobacteriales bacterium]|nr:phosphoglucomutase/phosphomannomutase family protein [Terriglobales bacterium]
MKQIKFGTDGWRGIIADDFTFDGVRQCAAATARYLLQHEDASKGIVIGYDTRFLSRDFAQAAAEVIAEAGIDVTLSDDYTPTPAVSYAVKHRGLAGGVMITSSHNPAQWNGYKYKASYGGSGRPAIIKAIEAELGVPLPKANRAGKIVEADLKRDYVAALKAFVDLDVIKASGMKFGIDTMYGSGRGIMAGIFAEAGVPHVAIRGEVNPLFPGINPEPIEPHTRACQEMVAREGCAAGLITDGDADRIGACDEHGNYVTSHMIFAIILRWLLERKRWSGDVVRAFNTTKMLDRIAAKHGRKLLECGIGFKFICDLMLEREILVGGEESGGIGIARHLPERDGILNSLILANIMAEEGRTLGELVSDLFAEYGAHYYGRIDLHIPNDIKESAISRAQNGVSEFGGLKVLRREGLDGVKFFLDDRDGASDGKRAEAWLLLRASGTEPLLRIYSEAGSPELVQRLLAAGREFTLGQVAKR